VDPENVVQQSIDRLIVGSMDCRSIDQSINQSINLYFAQICKNNDNSCTKYTVTPSAGTISRPK